MSAESERSEDEETIGLSGARTRMRCLLGCDADEDVKGEYKGKCEEGKGPIQPKLIRPDGDDPVPAPI